LVAFENPDSSRFLRNSFFPVARPAAAVRDSDYPDVVGTIDIEEGKRELFDAQFLNFR
jgi:hypothetical protein